MGNRDRGVIWMRKRGTKGCEENMCKVRDEGS